MRVQAIVTGLFVSAILAACAPGNSFDSVDAAQTDSSAANYDYNLDDIHLPLQKATVNPNVVKENEEAAKAQAQYVATDGADIDLPPATAPEQEAKSDSKTEEKADAKTDAPADSKNDSKSDSKADAKPDDKKAAVSADRVKRDKPPVNDIAESGNIKPTIYYFPVFDEDKGGCSDSEKVTLHGQGGKALIRVCRKNSKACGLQGSCSIIQKGKIRLFNILTRVSGQDRYFEISKEECRFGYGVNSICLDPFYTLAADMNFYKPGDVIYIPSIVGTVLPSGTLHDGYFIVRDKGQGIKGRGRFDFYSGLLSWRDIKNPFAKLGLADTKTAVPYYKVRGKKASEILLRRGYPKLPVHQEKFVGI